MHSMSRNPFHEMEMLLDRYSRLTGWCPPDGPEDLSAPDWSPCTDVEETPALYLVNAELPGVRKQDITVCLSGGTLEIRGDKRAAMKPPEGNRRHRNERLFGRFCRAFNLPPDVDAASASASFSDGVLTVCIPRSGQRRSAEQHIRIA